MHCAHCIYRNVLSVHMTSVLILVWFNNFALTMGFYWSYTLLLKLPVLVRSCWTLLLFHSLVPRPSHCPVFDCLQYAKTEGEGLVSFIT